MFFKSMQAKQTRAHLSVQWMAERLLCMRIERARVGAFDGGGWTNRSGNEIASASVAYMFGSRDV